ncbi:MAG: ATP phosphoribosyltransferase, partial [Patescibacteria group bacterium]
APRTGKCQLDAAMVQRLTRRFFVGKQSIEVVESPGTAEAEVPLKYRFGMALSETGRSLRENGLVSLGIIFTSNTVLVANREALADTSKSEEIYVLKLLLLGALQARSKVLLSMNVSADILESVLKILPAMNSPTIATLADTELLSVSSAITKTGVNSLVPKLLKLGARGVMITPISSIIEKW